MSVPRLVGTASSVVSGTTVVVTLTDNVPTGEHLVAAWGIDGDKSFTAASDSKANTWQTDITRRDGTRNIAAALCSAKVTNALVIGDTVTFTQQSGAVTNERHAAVWAVQGLKATGWVERVLDPGASASFSSWSGQLDRAHMTSQANTLIAGVSIFGQAGTNGYIPGGMWDEANLTSGSGRVLAGVKATTWRDYYDWLAATGGGSLPSTIPLMVVYLDADPGTDPAMPELTITPDYGAGGASWLEDALVDAPRRDGLLFLDAGTYPAASCSRLITRHGKLYVRLKRGVSRALVIFPRASTWTLMNLRDIQFSGFQIGTLADESGGGAPQWIVNGHRAEFLGFRSHCQFETTFDSHDIVFDRCETGGRLEDFSEYRLDLATTLAGAQSASAGTINVASTALFANPADGTNPTQGQAYIVIGSNRIRYRDITPTALLTCTLVAGPGGTMANGAEVRTANSDLWPGQAFYCKGAKDEIVNKRITVRRCSASGLWSMFSENSWVDSITVEDCYCSEVQMRSGGDHSDGVRLEGHATDIRWRRVQMHLLRGENFFVKDASSPGYFADLELDGCATSETLGGAGYDALSVRGVVIKNCTFASGPVELGGSNYAIFNTVAGSVINGLSAGFSHDYNIFVSVSGFTRSANETAVEPTYTDYLNGDLELLAGDPGRNAGVAEFNGIKASDTDILGRVRPYPGTNPDIGAWERQTV